MPVSSGLIHDSRNESAQDVTHLAVVERKNKREKGLSHRPLYHDLTFGVKLTKLTSINENRT